MTARNAAGWPRLGLGCGALGAPTLDDATAQSVIEAAIERGLRLFDVAPLYGGGLAEERLGRVLKELPRNAFILCTKTGVTRPYAQAAIPPGDTRRRAADRWDYSRAATRRSVATSLERLQVDRLDVVHLHDVDDHLAECLEAHAELESLRAQGIIGEIGIGSNLAGPVAILLERARFGAFLVAGRYTLLDQSALPLYETARARGIIAIAGGIFNSGVLARWPNEDATFDYSPASDDVRGRVARLASLCARHGTPLAAAAIQFALAHPGVRTVLLGPQSLEELDECLAAATFNVPVALWRDLRALGLVDPACPLPEAEIERPSHVGEA